MKITDILFKSIAAGFGWTVGKNLANGNKGGGCMTIIGLFLLAAILKIITILI